MDRKRFLFVSPHPDDAELGVGGTILKLKETGHKAFVVDMTSGEPTPFGTQEKREKETQKATKILKLDQRLNLCLPNRYLFDSKEARLLLAEKIRLLKPDIIFCPHPADAHPDHVATAAITEGARFYAKYTKVKLKGAPHYVFRILYYYCSHLRAAPEFSFLIDISKQFKKKKDVMRCYRSQFINNPNNKFILDYVETFNRYFGRLINAEYAEPVYSKEVIKIENLTCLV